MAVYWDTGVQAIISLVKNYSNKLPQTEHGRLVIYLVEALDPVMIQKMDKQVLTLLVPHYLLEVPCLILI